MKKTQYIIYTLAAAFLLPGTVLASTTGGSSISSELDVLDKVQAFIDFLSGPILIAVGTLFGVIAGFSIMKSKANDNRAWEWMGRIGIGMVIITAIGGIISVMFGGATI